MPKNSFVLYTEQKAVINKLSDEQAGKLIKAIYEYVETGELKQLDPVTDLVITPFITVLDKDLKKYEETKKKRAEAGAKGGKQTQANAKDKKQIKANQANASNDKQNKANESKTKQSQAVYDNEYVNVNDNVYINNIDRKIENKNNLINLLNSKNFFEKIVFVQDETSKYNEYFKDKDVYIDYESVDIRTLDKKIVIQKMLTQVLVKNLIDTYSAEICEKLNNKVVEKVFSNMLNAEEIDNIEKYFISSCKNEVIKNGT